MFFWFGFLQLIVQGLSLFGKASGPFSELCGFQAAGLESCTVNFDCSDTKMAVGSPSRGQQAITQK